MSINIHQLENAFTRFVVGGSVPPQTESVPLIERARSAGVESFVELCLHFANQLYSYIFYQVDSSQIAGELTLEIYMEAYRKFAFYKPGEDFLTWLYRIAHDYLKVDPRFVSSIPFKEKQVLLLKFMGGLNNQQVGQVIRENPNQIVLLQYRALSMIQNDGASDNPPLDKELAGILDSCLNRIESGESIVRCLHQYNAQRDQLMKLLQVYLKLSGSNKINLPEKDRDQFLDNLTSRLKLIPEKSIAPRSVKVVSKADLEENLSLPKHKSEEGASPPYDSPNLSGPPADNTKAKYPGPGSIATSLQGVFGIFRRSRLLTVSVAITLVVLIGAIALLTGSLGFIGDKFKTDSIVAASLTLASGTVETQTSGDKTWTAAATATKLQEGMRIRTGGSSRASLSLADGSSLNLDAATELQINQAKFKTGGPNSVLLTQFSGKITSQIAKQPGADSHFELDTPSAAIVIKGTKFTTEVSPDGKTQIKVDEGIVSVTGQNKTIDVKAGNQVTVEKGKAPGEVVPVASPTPTPTQSSTPVASPTPSPTPPPPPTFALTLKSGKGGTISQPASTATANYTAGTLVSLVAVPDPGYAFAGWTGDIADVIDPKAASTTMTVKGKTSLNANFIQVFLLTIKITGGSITAPGDSVRTYPTGTVVNLSVNPDAGFQFVNWTGDVSTIADVKSAQTTITIKANATITANFVSVYNLTIKTTTGGWTIKPGEGTFTYVEGTSVDVLAVPDGGNLFAGWLCEGSSISDATLPGTKVLMVKNTTLTPKFIKTAKLFTLTTKASAGGQISQPGTGTFSCMDGSAVNLQAVPSSGYAFLNWSGDTAGVANVFAGSTTVIMKSNCTLTANFIVTFNLMVSTSTGGTVAQPGVAYIYNSGSIVPLNALPSQGYVFTNWSGDITGITDPNSASTTLRIIANTNITANFARLNSLTLNAGTGGTINQPATNTSSVKEGSVVTITAVANAGYTFVNWTGDISNVANPGAASTTISIKGDCRLTANFIQATPAPP
jgi:hypothetical protein